MLHVHSFTFHNFGWKGSSVGSLVYQHSDANFLLIIQAPCMVVTCSPAIDNEDSTDRR